MWYAGKQGNSKLSWQLSWPHLGLYFHGDETCGLLKPPWLEMIWNSHCTWLMCGFWCGILIFLQFELHLKFITLKLWCPVVFLLFMPLQRFCTFKLDMANLALHNCLATPWWVFHERFQIWIHFKTLLANILHIDPGIINVWACLFWDWDRSFSRSCSCWFFPSRSFLNSSPCWSFSSGSKGSFEFPAGFCSKLWSALIKNFQKILCIISIGQSLRTWRRVPATLKIWITGRVIVVR